MFARPTTVPRFRLAAAVAAVALAGLPARAGFVVAPNANVAAEGDFNNLFPFGIVDGFFVPSVRYQQVYSASQFAAFGGPQAVTELRFRADGPFGYPFAATLPNVRIDLSVTAAVPGGLSLTFADNVGANNATVFSGPLALSSAAAGPGPRPFDIVIPLTTPFVYDPGAGNLLLDVRNFGGAGFGIPAFDGVSGSPVTSRVFADNVNATTGRTIPSGSGLVTGFTFRAPAVAAVPAPPTAAALAAGLAGFRKRPTRPSVFPDGAPGSAAGGRRGRRER